MVMQPKEDEKTNLNFQHVNEPYRISPHKVLQSFLIVKNNKGGRGLEVRGGAYLTSALFKWKDTTLSTPPDTMDLSYYTRTQKSWQKT